MSGYLGLSARLKYVDLWCKLPSRAGDPALDSERWHRDHEDRRVVKLFVYLHDVDASMGPLEYLWGTHPGARYGSVFPARPALGSYPRAAAVEEAMPVSQAFTCTGEAGTLILCDTTGLHRAGPARSRPRILFTATYASRNVIDPIPYGLPGTRPRESLGPLGRLAIR